MHVCMLAAENDRLPGGKVGGIGDVLRDLPPALADEGAEVSVIVPSYGAFHELPGARLIKVFTVPFAGKLERVELVELADLSAPGVRQYVLHHAYFGVGGHGVIYCDDPPGRPFASDATKFALFSVAALTAIREGFVEKVHVLHLHDWHTALAAVLLAFDRSFEPICHLRVVYSIHNLALQGIRPFSGDQSSLDGWFPGLRYDIATLTDPRWSDCINPMAACIRLADRVNTVSPTYAREILEPNNAQRGFHGGEGLESDLVARHAEGRLFGIINGIAYNESQPDPQSPEPQSLAWRDLTTALGDGLLATLGSTDTLPAADYLAHQRLLRWQADERPRHLLTSVGRLTAQKVALLLHQDSKGTPLLDTLLERLAGRGALVILGTGDVDLERACQRIAARHSHFCFLRRFSMRLSELLFAHGDLFLMPSSFEPCGISQMLAMQAGQPPLVHAVGGLADTVSDNEDGFAFGGDSTDAQAESFLARVDDALELRENKPKRWQAIVDTALSRRFYWRVSAKRYLDELYT